jgi:hypothetical protein
MGRRARACRLRTCARASALACSLVAGEAAAQAPPPAERAQVYSAYEQQTIDLVLSNLALVRDAAPEGKTIDRVEIAPLDVFEERDPLPRVLNVFHVTSRKRVIQRELLLGPGDPYTQVLVDDTLRNLRRLPQLSIVLAVAARSTTPDRVVLVVVTKDVWSLRLNWDVVATAGGLEELTLQPSETNFLGTHQTAFGLFDLQPSAFTLGLGYTMPRLDGTRVAVDARANVVVNRASGSPEGSYGSLVIGQPLYSGTAPWAWDATVAWKDYPFRHYVDARPSLYLDQATGHTIPYEYRIRDSSAVYEVTRSLGWDVKHDFTLAMGASRRVYRVDPAGADPRTVADFIAAAVPVSDTAVGPSIQYHTYAKRYLRVIDFDSLALQEDYHLGHDLVLRASPSFRALGASRDLVDLYGAAQYTVPVRDGLMRASFQIDAAPETNSLPDAYVYPTAHLVSPTVAGVARVVVDGTLLYRWRNYLNSMTFSDGFLGGSDRLRGYPTNYFVGPSYVAYNVEIRSRPVEILSSQIGAVLFYDAGGAFQSIDAIQPFRAVGAGLRGLLPWLDRVVLRVDLGIPLQRPLTQSGAPIPPYSAVVTFGQAFAVPTVAPPSVLPTGESESAQ